ncbi:MAG: hypothetical protein AB7U99_12670, partial [Steroidobacteraceae bacterium]
MSATTPPHAHVDAVSPAVTLDAASAQDNAAQGIAPMSVRPKKQGLYDPQFEHDACGVGFVVDMKGRKSHRILQQGIEVLKNLDHRGASGSEVNTGDGAGVLMQMPHKFLVE